MTLDVYFSYAEMLEQVHKRLEYFGGKSAVTSDDFFRIKSCSADNAMLRTFIESSISWLVISLRRKCSWADIRMDQVTFTIDSGSDSYSGYEEILGCSVREIIINRTVALWFFLFDYTFGKVLLDKAQSGLDILLESIRNPKAKPRRVPPL